VFLSKGQFLITQCVTYLLQRSVLDHSVCHLSIAKVSSWSLSVSPIYSKGQFLITQCVTYLLQKVSSWSLNVSPIYCKRSVLDHSMCPLSIAKVSSWSLNVSPIYCKGQFLITQCVTYLYYISDCLRSKCCGNILTHSWRTIIMEKITWRCIYNW
jgi:hypothetical protein